MFKLAYLVYPFKRVREITLDAIRFSYWIRMQGDLDGSLVERAVSASRKLVEFTDIADPRRPFRMSQLSFDLLKLHACGEEPRHLEEALKVARTAAQVAPQDSLRRHHILAQLAACLAAHYDLSADVRSVDEAIAILVDIVQTADLQEARGQSPLNLLCIATSQRASHGDWNSSLYGVISIVRNAVDRFGGGVRAQVDQLAALVSTLCGTVATTHDQTLLVEVVLLARAALAQNGPTDPLHATHSVNLAAVLYHNAVIKNDADALAESVKLRREALEANSSGPAGSLDPLRSLGHALATYYELTGDPGMLEEAVSTYRRGVELSVELKHERPASLARLSDALRLRYALHGDTIDLREAVETAREAADTVATDDPRRPVHLNHLGLVLWCAHEAGDGPEALNGAILRCRDAVTAAASDDSDLPVYLLNLCGMLNARSALVYDPYEAQEAVAVGRRAAATAGGLNRWRALSQLSNALMRVYQDTGDLDTLNEAIETADKALATVSTRSRGRATVLADLSEHLHGRFGRTGDPADLDHAVELARQAVKAHSHAAPTRARLLLSLGLALMTRAIAENDDSVLRDALPALREASRTAPRATVSHAASLASLAGCLWQWFERTGDASVLDEGISAAEQAAGLSPKWTERYRVARMNLSMLLWVKFRTGGDVADIDRAVVTARGNCAEIRENSSYYALTQVNCGEILNARFEALGDEQDRSDALKYLREATGGGHGQIRTRIQAARRLANLAAARNDWREATTAFTTAVRLLPQLAPRYFYRRSQQRVLALFPELPSDSAAAALQLGEQYLALELLEHGRGILLSQTLDTRSDLTDLRSKQPALAQRLDRLRQQLDAADITTATSVRTDSSVQHVTESWDRLVAEIREHPGFERFLMPPSEDELGTIARDGPVVVVNVSRLRSDALLITNAGVEVVQLPDQTHQIATEHARQFDDALKIAHDENTSLGLRLRAENDIRETLAWLWDTVAEPILAVLGSDGHRRLWWMPTGPLSHLPLHAAGRYPLPGQTSTNRANHSVLDNIVSSYTPTLRSLLNARTTAQRAPAGQPLVVAVSDTRLRDVQAEVTDVASWLHAPLTLTDSNATYDRVMAGLASANWVHFACHGNFDADDPSRSHLALADRPLSVLDVSKLQIQDGQFAMLSACGTAQAADSLANESIHLAGAFHLAGYRGVIGTMWPVADDIARAVTAQVYQSIHNHGGDDAMTPAPALHAAIQQARRQWPHTPSMWAS